MPSATPAGRANSDARTVRGAWHVACVRMGRRCTRSAACAFHAPMPSTALTPAGKADLAYQAIRRAVMEQGIVPGTKLPEEVVGAQFGISRTLVRAVLARLAAE